MAENFSVLTKTVSGSIEKQSCWLAAAACALFFALPIKAAQSLEPKWPPGLYRYIVVDQDLRDILTEFGRNLNITGGVEIGPQVAGRKIRGRMPITTAKEFLNQLCQSYGLVWYYDGAKLHINVEDDVRTETVGLGRVNSTIVKERLKELGITDARYAVLSSSDNSRLLSVAGPPRYRELVRETVAALQPVEPAQPKLPVIIRGD